MAVSTDAQKLQVNSADLSDRILVPGTKCFWVLGQPIRHMGLLEWNLYPPKQLLPHETRVTLIFRIRLGQVFANPQVFVQVESRDAGEIQPLLAMHAHEFSVRPDGR